MITDKGLISIGRQEGHAGVTDLHSIRPLDHFFFPPKKSNLSDEEECAGLTLWLPPGPTFQLAKLITAISTLDSTLRGKFIQFSLSVDFTQNFHRIRLVAPIAQ